MEKNCWGGMRVKRVERKRKEEGMRERSESRGCERQRVREMSEWMNEVWKECGMEREKREGVMSSPSCFLMSLIPLVLGRWVVWQGATDKCLAMSPGLSSLLVPFLSLRGRSPPYLPSLPGKQAWHHCPILRPVLANLLQYCTQAIIAFAL